MVEIKKMDVKEFREKGYLQELNRIFLHPLGLALSVNVNNGVEELASISDYRDDVEGLIYDLSNSDNERITRFNKNKDFIANEFKIRLENRKEVLGFEIEPIPERTYKGLSIIIRSEEQFNKIKNFLGSKTLYLNFVPQMLETPTSIVIYYHGDDMSSPGCVGSAEYQKGFDIKLVEFEDYFKL